MLVGLIIAFFVFDLMLYFLIVQHAENVFLKNQNENLNKQLSGFSSAEQKPVPPQPFWNPIDKKPPNQFYDLREFERRNIRFCVFATLSNFHPADGLGGFWGATVILTNNSDYVIDSAEVLISIFRVNETLYTHDWLRFTNINPHAFQQIQLPPSPHGQTVQVKVQSIVSNELDLHGNF